MYNLFCIFSIFNIVGNSSFGKIFNRNEITKTIKNTIVNNLFQRESYRKIRITSYDTYIYLFLYHVML